MEGSALVNGAIYYLLRGILPAEAMARATAQVELGNALRDVLKAAVRRDRTELENSGWVRHTLESAVWSLRNTDSFEEAVVQVVNLGNDADTAGAVIGALAGAAYGLASIPTRWRSALRGEWPLGSGQQWNAERLIALADRLVAVGGDD
jgi:ADP-ribosyl-[dinitrogen reductase] hydrolase